MTPVCRACWRRPQAYPAPLAAAGRCWDCYRARRPMTDRPPRRTPYAIAAALLGVAAITAAAAVTATTWTALVLGMVPAGIALTLAVAILAGRKADDDTRGGDQ